MLAAHAEIPPGTLPTHLLSDHDLRQCGMDPVQVRQLENELAEMGLGLGISIGGIFRGVKKGIGAVGKVARGAVRIAAPVAQFIPGPIGIAATGFTAADQFLRGPGEEVADPFAPIGPSFMEARPGGPPPMMTDMRYRGTDFGPTGRGGLFRRRRRKMGYWRNRETGQVMTGASGVPPTRQTGWTWSATPPAGAPAVMPATPVRPPSTAPTQPPPPTDGMSLEERIAGIVGRILPAVPQIVDAITAPQAPTWEPPPVQPQQPFAPPSPVDVTVTGAAAPAPAGAMPPWLIPAALGVAALVVLPRLGRRAS